MTMKWISKTIKYLPKIFFFIFIFKPLTYLILGINIRGREHLIKNKPSIIVANHNSHLDVLVIMSLFSIKELINVRPVGAVDYFFKSKLRLWAATRVFDAIPICRSGEIPKSNILEPCEQALDNGNTIIIFPEGTRGEPEHMGELRKGICYLARRKPNIPITTIFLHGTGKSLPKGEALFVPFFVDIFISKPILSYIYDDCDMLLEEIKNCFDESASQVSS